MDNIPTPESLFQEVEKTIPDTVAFKELVQFAVKALSDNAEALSKGLPLRVMVSCETSREDIEALCQLFWSKGWVTSYLSCPPRHHQVFFNRPRFYGMPGNRVSSIH